MRRRYDEYEPLTTEEAFSELRVEDLKPLAALLTKDKLTRKGELVTIVTNFMRQPAQVRTLYEKLEPLAQKAVQEAAHDPRGQLHGDRFIARYGGMPGFHHADPNEEPHFYGYSRYSRPTILALFFPSYKYLPTDLRGLLLTFVPAPPPFTLPTLVEPPAIVRQTWTVWKGNRKVEESEDVLLRVRATAREALHDVKAVLRLVETRRVRVSDKKRQPTAASLKALAAVLASGDFYSEEDQEKETYEAAADLAIKAFAWPMVLQAAGLAEKKGDHLELTMAGRKALTRPAEEVIRAAWKKWRTSTLLDEFSRVEVIKGQGKAGLSALAERRKAVIDGLAACPAGHWFALGDFFRFLRATDRNFEVARRAYDLYIAEHYYGNLGEGSSHTWEQLQGRYILALLFEYAATLGLIDVGYLVPQGAREDFHDRWGADDYSCLSRYDGLLYARINPLGAWCLGQAEKYEPPPQPVVELLQVLPNLDVVIKGPPLPAADRLLLERFAEQTSEAVWHLSKEKVLPALEEGFALDELVEFLTARNAGALPHTVQVFLDDLRDRAGQLRDRGLARMIECRDAAVATLLANDPQLRGRCQLAGERILVFREEEETAVRRGLRRLGYILPPRE